MSISAYIITVAVGVVSVFVSGVCVYVLLSRIANQRRLRKAITLVELKCVKLHYVIFAALSGAGCLYFVGQAADTGSPERAFFASVTKMTDAAFNVTIICAVVMMALIFGMFVLLASSKAAVVDKGIYTGIKYVEWYEIYDYLLDEKKCRVIFTLSSNTFTTLSGTTPPYKFRLEDASKLTFILNKNKNSF